MTDSSHGRNPVEAVAEDFLERYRRGERPSVSDYIRHHPEIADEIRGLFPALLVMEDVRLAENQSNSSGVARGTEFEQPIFLGDFRIIREVGRGGMGVVYEAEQVSLGRRVALKVLPKQILRDSKQAKRFEREARAAARLHHTNIVPVFGVGQQDGLHYYVMQFIHGLGLDEVLVELKRLREVSEFPHTTAEHQFASGAAADAAEQAAVGKNVSALSVAQSLVSGQFERTLLVDDGEPPSAVRDQQSALSGQQTVPADSKIAAAPSTTVGHLSDTFALPGQSEHSNRAQSRAVYWQSVARIGVQTADALQYAHDQGVIHRDVKPGNLLLDTRGCAWVTDFGLAKATDQQDLTHTGDVLGTLRYMAPEQFEGHADARSDVYSLGLTLYELLALQPAFDEKDRHRLVKKVANGTPARLRTIDPHIPRDLETIVHKAIDREPGQRYQTAGELAADLQRYLGDEPIRARRISPVTRIARWCKRNPAGASVVLLLVAGLIGALTAAGVFMEQSEENARLAGNLAIAVDQAQQAEETALQEKKDAEQAQDHEKKLREEAQRQTEIAEKALAEAQRQKTLAQMNFARARRAVDEYLSKVTQDQLLSVPGLQPLREDLLKSALEFYTEFTQEQSDDPTLQVELAAARYRLGVIQRDLGNKEAARSANDEAIRLLEVLRDREAGGVEVLTILADAYFLAGVYDAHRYDDAVALCQKILETNPDAAAVSRTLAETYNTLAIARSNAKDYAEALELHQHAFEIRQKLVQQDPEDAAYNASLASTINNLGVMLAYQKRIPEKLAMFQLAVPYNEKACRLAPHSITWGRWMAITFRNIGMTQRELGHPSEALAALQKQVDVWRRLVTQNPAVSYLRTDYYKALLLLAEQQQRMGLTVEANRSNRDALDVLAQMRRETPAELFELATVYAALAAPPDPNEELSADTPDAADERQRNADLALVTLQKAVDAGWADPAALKNYKVFDPLREREQFQQLAKVVETVAEAQRLLAGNAATDAAKLADQQKALEVLNKLGAESPDQKGHQRVLASTYHSIGLIQTSLKQFEDAEKSLNEALQLREKLRFADPDDPFAASHWLATRIAIGQLYWEHREYAEAHRRWQECLAETLALAEAHRDDKSLLTTLGDIEHEAYARYASYGLLPLVHESIRRTVEFERLKVVDVDGTINADFEAAVVRLDDRDLARRFFEQYAKAVSANPKLTFEVVGLARGVAALGDMALLSDDAMTRTRNLFEVDKSRGWIGVAVAMLHYRAGEYEDARAILAPLASSNSHQVAFLDAAIAWKLGDEARARQRWSDAERVYRETCRNALTSDGIDVKKGVFKEHWWQFGYGQVMRRLANEALSGGQHPPDDPWQHLIQARGYRLIGEIEKSDAELAAAEAAAPDDTDVRLARAELLDRWGEMERAEADWQKVVDRAGDNPIPWIHRGRRAAQNGQEEKANADFAQAARLTDRLNPFLEAGWWVAGPVRANEDFEQPHPIENQAEIDPSQSLMAANGQTQLAWQTVPTGEFGYVDISTNGSPGVKYAIAWIYSDRPQQMTLLLGGHAKAQVWLNGAVIAPTGELNSNPFFYLQRLPVTLQAGRNTLLIKLAQRAERCDFYLRFPEGDLDRGIDYFERGLYAAAVDLLERGLPRAPSSSTHPWMITVRAMRAADVQGDRYRRICETLLARYGDGSNKYGAMVVVTAGGLTAEPVIPHDQLIQLAEVQLSLGPKSGERITGVGMALYRAGRYAEAWDRLAGATESHPPCWPLAALIHHALGDNDSATRWMVRARQWYDQNLTALADGTQKPHWNWAEFVTLLREAAVQIEGRELLDDPRLHLWRARSWAGLREFDQAEAELAASANLAPGRTDIWLAIARLRDEWDQPVAAAEANWAKIIELAGDDPMPWIQRGRWYAEHGHQEKADADYAKAASLTPNELNKFLEAGWWVVGPYPAELTEFCPPEVDPDPSRSVYVSNSRTGISETPEPWRTVPTDRCGRFSLADVPGVTNSASYYAVTHIFSPSDRTILLGINGVWDPNEAEHRVWLNGQAALPVRFTSAWRLLKTHYPLALRAGRNTLLIKAPFLSGQIVLTARLGDHPVDRGMDLGRFGLFNIAVEPIERACRDVPEWSNYPRNMAAHFALTAGDRERYERIAMACYEHSRNEQDPHIAWLLNLGPVGGVNPQELSDWVDRWRNKQSPSPNHYVWRMYALAKYRIGVPQQTLDVLLQHPELSESPHSQTIMALALHKLGRVEEARQQLDKAHTWLTQLLEQFPGDGGTGYLPDFYPTFREAYQLIHGDTREIDTQFDEFVAKRRQLWEQRDPLTAAFDDAVRNAPTDSNAYLARGRRLAELGRLDEAEADFNKAVELAPDDVLTAVSRALYLADRGDVQRAADQTWRAFEIGSGDAEEPLGRYVEGLFAARRDVLEELLHRYPDAAFLHRLHGDYLAWQGRWDEARQSFASGEPFWSHEICAAAISSLRDDAEGISSALQRADGLWEPQGLTRRGMLYHRTWMQCLQPLPEEQAEELVKQLRAAVESEGWLELRQALGLALYRIGRFQEAAETLGIAHGAGESWQFCVLPGPILAMTHWQLGHADTARMHLEQTADALRYWQRGFHQGRMAGGSRFHNPWWMITLAYHRQARTLIDGPEVAQAEFEMLSTPPAVQTGPTAETSTAENEPETSGSK